MRATATFLRLAVSSRSQLATDREIDLRPRSLLLLRVAARNRSQFSEVSFLDPFSRYVVISYTPPHPRTLCDLYRRTHWEERERESSEKRDARRTSGRDLVRETRLLFLLSRATKLHGNNSEDQRISECASSAREYRAPSQIAFLGPSLPPPVSLPSRRCCIYISVTKRSRRARKPRIAARIWRSLIPAISSIYFSITLNAVGLLKGWAPSPSDGFDFRAAETGAGLSAREVGAAFRSR